MLQDERGRMLSRPKPGESEADLLHFQNQFLAARASPAVKIVKKADKRRGEEGSTDAEIHPLQDRKDVVMLDGNFPGGVLGIAGFLSLSVPQCLPFHRPLNPELLLPCVCVLLAVLFVHSLVG